MPQIALLPERLKSIVPNSTNSADSPGIGIAYSGQRYILKKPSVIHNALPASEWICHSLARCIELAIPAWAVCEMSDGQTYFGSRLEGQILSEKFMPMCRPDADNPEVISRTYVLDMFTGNLDRHPGNWLLTEAGGSKLLRPIDYSRAWFFRWPPLPLPPFGDGVVGDNSSGFYNWAITGNVVLRQEALDAVRALRSISKSTWEVIINSIP